MNPQLVALAGPLKGTTINVPEREVSLGRDPSNWLPIDSTSVSRRHCKLTRSANEYAVLDLDSLNGTFVNGLPVKERELRAGDLIAIGDSLFLFAQRGVESAQGLRRVDTSDGAKSESSGAVSSAVEFDPPGESRGRATTRMRTENLLYLRPEKLVEALPSAGRLEQDLQALLKIAATIGSENGLEALEQQLLDSMLEVVPAERAAIFLVEDDPNEFVSIFGRERGSDGEGVVSVSHAIVYRMLREGKAVLGNDFPNSKYALDAPENSPVQAVLAVPIVAFEKIRGVVYLDTRDPNVKFEQHHLQLLSAIGSIAAMPLESARHVEWLRAENRRLQQEIDIEHSMIGETGKMRRVYQFISKVAPTDSTVLVSGESGTGKELVARDIHANSERADKPFIAINCAALTESLLESELFGHEKGAFTGAFERKKGKLEVADQGTVFLDEIGELAPQLQAKLLRVLQDHKFDRVGGTRPVEVDIRLIAATNRDLHKDAESGRFREDLFYRLNVVSIELPPLRERREDIPLLAQYFLTKHSKRSKRPVTGLSHEARRCLSAYDWQGNVRELENAIERAVVLGSSEVILPEDLPEAILETKAGVPGSITKYHDAVNETKKQLILNAVQRAKGNFTAAAKQLGLHANYLHRLIRNLDLRGEIQRRQG